MANIEVREGKNRILAVRALKDEATAAGMKLALQVSHEIRYTRSAESTDTKDGRVNKMGPLVVELELTAVASNDPLQKRMRQAAIKGEILEFWEIRLDEPVAEEPDTYAALYMRGYLSEWPEPSPTGGIVEINTSASIDGEPREDSLTLTAELLEELEAGQYGFRDLTKIVTVP